MIRETTKIIGMAFALFGTIAHGFTGDQVIANITIILLLWLIYMDLP